ncbi:hypothetical protein IU436_16525 [Nocardia farcinica]|uniref:hypothetical protein n=2 Tax=Nocardia farcinica TaxID=37329 RepID=UPI000B1FC664|nr:hypothetical protein [Nocardia farcinica]MBF6258686.1 hypothetical protein [Nocardia farcinica]MBF6420721.1 hypothetical protein [Nocardia farcinica]MBF6431965.1 hypothetical protein [Nocardia farcinica]MBF6502675.1 hypothetical protein [Nocardia farcinica]
MTTRPDDPMEVWKAPTQPAPAPTPLPPQPTQPIPPRQPPDGPVPRPLYPRPVFGLPDTSQGAPPSYSPPSPPMAPFPLVNVSQHNVSYGGRPLVQRAFPHGLHLVLSLITCGLWLPVWLIHYLVSGSR